MPGHKDALRHWAQQNGLEIEEAERRLLCCGPFTFLRSTGQSVYRIHVRDARGEQRKGFARVGGFFGLGDHVKVAWDRGS